MTSIENAITAERLPVSIGIPVYNGERYLRAAIESALQQTYKNIELIIADNASTDGTRAICEEFVSIDSRVKYIRHSTNIGPLDNFRFVISEAKHTLFTWLAHDDLLEPSFLEETVAAMEHRPENVLVTPDFNYITDDGALISTERLELVRESVKWKHRCRYFFCHSRSHNIYISFYGLVKTNVASSAIHSIPKMAFLSGLELPFLARVAARGEIVSIPSVLRSWRYHDQSTYGKEEAAFAGMPRLRALWLQGKHDNSLAIDQLKVLFKSSLPIRFKWSILLIRSCQAAGMCWSRAVAVTKCIVKSAIRSSD